MIDPGRGCEPGSGLMANNNATCAVSGTGDGELFMRTCLAFNIASRILHLNESLGRAAAQALAHVKKLGGDGGLVAIDRRGNIAMPYNSAGMYRASVSSTSRPVVATFR